MLCKICKQQQQKLPYSNSIYLKIPTETFNKENWLKTERVIAFSIPSITQHSFFYKKQ